MNFRNQHLWRHLAADYIIIMSRTLKVTSNHVMCDRGAWFLRVIMSSSCALSCLPSVEKQKHDFHFFNRSMYNKRIIRFGFCDIQNNVHLFSSFAVTGGWSSWGKWCACSKSCGAGSQYRTRTCTKPAPSYGGKQCTGKDKETRYCNTHHCPGT